VPGEKAERERQERQERYHVEKAHEAAQGEEEQERNDEQWHPEVELVPAPEQQAQGHRGEAADYEEGVYTHPLPKGSAEAALGGEGRAALAASVAAIGLDQADVRLVGAPQNARRQKFVLQECEHHEQGGDGGHEGAPDAEREAPVGFVRERVSEVEHPRQERQGDLLGPEGQREGERGDHKAPQAPVGGQQRVQGDQKPQRGEVVEPHLPVQGDAQGRDGEDHSPEQAGRDAPRGEAHDQVHQERRGDGRDQHQDAAGVHGGTEPEESSDQLPEGADLEPPEQGVIVGVGVKVELALLEHGPGRAHVGSLVDLVLGIAEHVRARKDRGNQQDGDDCRAVQPNSGTALPQTPDSLPELNPFGPPTNRPTLVAFL
jgi:hypothetical protein